ncbi:hypothetical protein [Mycolicibacterium aichiense]|uniref:Uncharacterized protein n=1 Tax=Mycolicibacterium aichiense TaxID=1799 RepID=A0AAD1HJN1_9MYCO|nr:hypothetical protein [Mycolicibacterium aichiense]MCV7019190.1 hypothetical protein [Mycolicibacterium aichiense]BBX06341.1 hypothetical protein MAIC_11440 [Mycolicibacterium aichiense]
MKALPAALAVAAWEPVRGDLARLGARVTLPPGHGATRANRQVDGRRVLVVTPPNRGGRPRNVLG